MVDVVTDSPNASDGRMGMTVAVTGAAGFIGSLLVKALREKGYKVVGIDRAIPTSQHTNDKKAGFSIKQNDVDIVADMSDAQACFGIFSGCNCVIHLAGDGNPSADFISSIVPNNIVSMYNVCEEAKRSKVKRVVFASTNHTQIYGFEQMNAAQPDFAGKQDKAQPQVDSSTPTNPSSLYGVSKILGEEMGKYYSLQMAAFEFIALRIGWVIYDDPFVHKGTPLNDYLECMFLSKRDCAGFFLGAVETKRVSQDVPFFVGYAVSDNTNRIYNYEETCNILEYRPLDGNR